MEGELAPDTVRVTRWIGPEGGKLELLGHTLRVPAGAVGAPTLFSMTHLPTGYLEVELLALRLDPVLGMVDVGEEGWANDETVRLSLSYAAATNVSDPRRLRVLHMREDGGVEALRSVVDTTRLTVSAKLEHFSRYCMAID